MCDQRHTAIAVNVPVQLFQVVNINHDLYISLVPTTMSIFPEEPLNDVCGYYPAYPGLMLQNGKWKVLRKLGYGLRCSVWLAQDLE